MTPHDVFENLGRRGVPVERGGHRVDRPIADLMALLSQVDELADHRRRVRDRLSLAVKGHDVAAQEQPAVDVLLKLAQHAVTGAAERDRRLVGELDRAPHQLRKASWTSADTRRPSARPPALLIAAFITAPIA